jgi:hypothetical protein
LAAIFKTAAQVEKRRGEDKAWDQRLAQLSDHLPVGTRDDPATLHRRTQESADIVFAAGQFVENHR